MGKGDPIKPKFHDMQVRVMDLDNDRLPIANAYVVLTSPIANYDAISNLSGIALLEDIDNRVTDCVVTVTKEGYDVYKGTYRIGPWAVDMPIGLYLSPVDPPIPVPDEPIVYPTKEQIRSFKGNFGGIIVNGLPTYDPTPTSFLYTPPYGAYHDDAIRKSIREEYVRTFGEHCHYVISLFQSNGYNGYYPTIEVSKSKQYLEELYRSKIIPVVPLMKNGEDIIDLPDETIDMIRCGFVMWEMNENGNTSEKMCRDIWNCRKRVHKDCLLYLHFTPDHSAAINGSFYYCSNCGYPSIDSFNTCPYCGLNVSKTFVNDDGGEADAWRWAKKIGVQGILVQTQANNDLAQNTDTVNSFTARMIGGKNGWPSLDVVIFEVNVNRAYHQHSTVEECQAHNLALRNQVFEGGQPNGYCNG